jgi:predicted metal-dependent phosphoesterase TrpH
VAVAPHPYRFWSGLGEPNLLSAKFKTIEVVNSRSLKKENKKAKRLAQKKNYGETGGSDCHSLLHLGRAYTKFENPIYDVDDALEQIRRKKTHGKGAYRKLSETPGYAASCVYLWLKRGMKRM